MTLLQAVLGAIPSDSTQSISRWWTLLDEHRDAWEAAQPVLVTHGPLAALEAFAAHTRGEVDDAVVSELRAAIVAGLAWSDVVLGWIADVAIAMDGDRAKAVVDTARERVTGLGYKASQARHVVRQWIR